jgi:hypothetical protein
VGWRKEAQAAGSAERASHILAAFAGGNSSTVAGCENGGNVERQLNFIIL